MKIVCYTVGKKHDREFVQAIEKYESRIRPYADFRFEFIATGDVESESNSVLKKISPEDKVVLLDETGNMLDNRELATILSGFQDSSTRKLVIIIGGAYGVNAELKARSDLIISLSRLVYPHQLVRLILAEQIYRSFNLMAGGKYHHG